jgi:hypothetical protein
MTTAYPGTVKVFVQKFDLVDTVFAAHINDLQNEVNAIETVLGINPMGSEQDVNTRLGAIESGYLNLSGSGQAVDNSVSFEGEPTFQVGTTALDHILLKGTGTRQVQIDNQGIQARLISGGTATDLLLQGGGGQVQIGGHTAWHSGNDGSGSGLDADTLDGVDSTGYATSTHAHGFSGQYTGIPSSGFVSVSFGVNVGFTPSVIIPVNQSPISGATFAPLLQGVDSLSPTGFRVRWINNVDFSPYNSPLTFNYYVFR